MHLHGYAWCDDRFNQGSNSSGATILSTTSFHDMAKAEGIFFIVLPSSVSNSTAAVVTVESATANSTATTYETTAFTLTSISTGQKNWFTVDCYKPEHRYVRLKVTGSCSGPYDAIVPLFYGPRLMGSTAVYSDDGSTQWEGSTVIVGKGT